MITLRKTWHVVFFNQKLEEQILAMPRGIMVRFLSMMEIMQRRNEIVVLHCFVKKTQKTPSRHLDIARMRMNEVKNAKK